MLIIGTGGLAGDILFSLQYEYNNDQIAFYNDANTYVPDYIKNNFDFLTNEAEAQKYFESTSRSFIVANGNNYERHYLSKKFEKLGGINLTYISKEARVGKYNTIHPKGCIILADAHITNDIVIDEGVIFYLRAGFGHYSHLKSYSLVSGGCNSSSATIGHYSSIGINVGIKPGVTIGNHVIIGTGAVITKDIEDYSIVVGNPQRIIANTKESISEIIEKYSL